MSHDDPIRMLLIEDNPADARFIRETLRDASDQSLDRGRELSGGMFTDGGPPTLTHETELESGLCWLDEEEFDVVLLDLDLPDSTGLDTLSGLLDHTETIPVVVLTGLRDRETGMEALRTGAEEYLVKDEITPELLIRSVYHAIERKAREREQKRYETLIEEATDVNAVLDPEGTFRYLTPSVEHVLGHDPDALCGEEVFDFIHPEDRETVKSEFSELIENQNYRATVECRFEHADGSWVTLHARGRNLLDDPAIEGIVVYTHDITERKEYEEQLEALNTTNQELTQAETAEEVARTGLEAAERILGAEIACVRLFDAETNALEPAAMTDEAEDLISARPAFDLASTFAGSAYRQDTVVHNIVDDDDLYGETASRKSLHLPLSDHGVLSVFVWENEGFTALERALAEALAANIRAALDRAAREDRLRENERELRQQHEQLETLYRITTLVQELGERLVEATTREELEQTVCERLAASDLYGHAWIGEVDATVDRVEVAVGAGVEDGYLAALNELPLEALGDGTVERALETDEIQVVQQYQAEDADAESDIDREAMSVEATAAIPLTHREQVYGVLVVHGMREDVFSERALTGFESLGKLVGFALSALRKRELLLSDTVVELELTVDDSATIYSAVTGGLDCRCRFDRSVPIEDGTVLNHYLIEGAETESVLEKTRGIDGIEEANVISEDDEGFVLQTVAVDSISQLALQAGASLESAVGEDGNAEVTLEMPQTVDVRDVVELFEAAFANVDMVAKRERERSVRTATEFRDAVTERLTEKQRMTLEAAYAAGYYEWPRDVTAEELAESLDISSSTLHQHLRNGTQGLLAEFLEEPRT